METAPAAAAASANDDAHAARCAARASTPVAASLRPRNAPASAAVKPPLADAAAASVDAGSGALDESAAHSASHVSRRNPSVPRDAARAATASPARVSSSSRHADAERN
jgi:hypothetical protein